MAKQSAVTPASPVNQAAGDTPNSAMLIAGIKTTLTVERDLTTAVNVLFATLYSNHEDLDEMQLHRLARSIGEAGQAIAENLAVCTATIARAIEKIEHALREHQSAAEVAR